MVGVQSKKRTIALIDSDGNGCGFGKCLVKPPVSIRLNA